MKKIAATLLLFIGLIGYSQTNGITYQAVILNPSGEQLPGVNNTNTPLSNKYICLKFSIIDHNSQLEYIETVQTTTDEFGMVNLVIGTGDQIGGYASSFSNILWNTNPKSLKVDLSTTGVCSYYTEISNQPFTAVPFALFAVNSESASAIATLQATVAANATATTNALALKEDAINKSTTTTLGNSNVLFPTQNAVKTYVDTNITSVNTSNAALQATVTANATAATNAIAAVQADVNQNEADSDAADLILQNNITTLQNTVTSNANATTTALALKEDTANKSTVTTLGTSNVLFPTQNAVKTYVDTNIATVNASNTALQATITANATTATNAIAAVQADVNQNETDSDAADVVLQNNITTLQNTVTSNANATTTALTLKEDAANKSTTTTLGNSNVLFPTQNAVKTYVDNQIASATIPDADASTKGKLQLAGDLAGTAAVPVVANNAITTTKIADSSVTDPKIVGVSGSKVIGNISGSAANVTGIIPVANGGTGVNTMAGIKSILGLNTNSIAIGDQAGQTNQQGYAVALGVGAGNTNQSGGAIAIGGAAGGTNQGNASVSIGSNAGQASQGTQAVAIGFAAGQNNQGANSVAIGAFAGNGQAANSISLNATGSVLNPQTTGFFVAPVRNASESNSLFYNTTTKEITYGTAAPSGPLNLATGVTGILPIANGGTGSSVKNFVDLSTAQTIAGTKAFSTDLNIFGITAGRGNSGVSYNTVFGLAALSSNTTGNYNNAFGSQALAANLDGYFNSAFGQTALFKNTSGNDNSAYGFNALNKNETGSNNSAMGSNSLVNNISGSGNTSIGMTALSSNTTGSNNTALGYQANVATNNLTNATAIGNGAIVSASNTIQLGNANVTNVNTNGALTAASVNAPIYASTPQVLNSGSTINWNPSLGLNASVTLNQNSNLNFLNTPAVGSYGTLIVTQDATGGRTINLPSTSNKVLGSTSTTTIALSSAANAKDILNFYYDGTNCYWNIGQGYGTAATVASTNLASGVSGTLEVANGGTGATTLTGIVKGNGTTALTAAVPGTDYQAPLTLTTTGSGAATLSGTTLNIPATTNYSLPTASASALGGVKVGTNLSIDGTGVLSTIAAPTFTGAVTAPIYASTPQALTDAATISWNPSNGLNASVTLGGNRTLSFSATPTVGSYGTLVITQDATGGRTITLPSTANKVLGSTSTTSVTLSSAAGAKDILNFYYDGTNCYWNVGQGYGTASTVASTNLASNVSGTLAVANGGTGATTLTGIVKGNGTGTMTAAVAGTDYVIPGGNITGTATNVTGTVAVANGGTGATTLTGYIKGNGASAMTASSTIPVSDISGAAPLASPALTGTPTAPTAAANTNTTQVATTAFVTTALSSAGLPSQSGNNGKFLTTNGSTASWASSAGVPYSGASGAVNLGNYNLTVYGIKIGTSGTDNSALQSNLVIGRDALVNTTNGYGNMAIGNTALYTNVGGYNNVAIGNESQYKNLWGWGNVSFGTATLNQNVIGNFNTAVGHQAGYFLTSSYNTAFGHNALDGQADGGGNTGVGVNAGGVPWNQRTYNSTFLGYNAKAQSGLDNVIVIGYNAYTNEHHTIQLGDNRIVKLKTSGTIWSNGSQLTSDARLKTNIEPLPNSIDLIMKLNPVHYTKKNSIESTDYAKTENGFIAQELQKVLPYLVIEGTDKDKILSVDYNSIIPVLTKGIQEQQLLIKAQQKQIDEMRLMLDKLIKDKK
jgi:hypothetical protein